MYANNICKYLRYNALVNTNEIVKDHNRSISNKCVRLGKLRETDVQSVRKKKHVD